MPLDPAIVGGGLKVLGGLFGGGGGDWSPAKPDENLVLHAKGARDAAGYGFNPLTLLGLGGQGYGPGGNRPPPLASLSILGDIVEDQYGQDGKDRREHNRLQNELLTLEVQRARSLSAVAPAASLAGGGAITGGRSKTAVGSFNGPSSSVFGAPGYVDAKWMTPGREDKVKPQEHGSGVLHYDNAITGPVTLLGDDGEPFMEYLQVPLVGGLQVMNNWAEKIARETVVPWIKGDPDWKPPKKDKFVNRDRYGRELPPATN